TGAQGPHRVLWARGYLCLDTPAPAGQHARPGSAEARRNSMKRWKHAYSWNSRPDPTPRSASLSPSSRALTLRLATTGLSSPRLAHFLARPPQVLSAGLPLGHLVELNALLFKDPSATTARLSFSSVYQLAAYSSRSLSHCR